MNLVVVILILSSYVTSLLTLSGLVQHVGSVFQLLALCVEFACTLVSARETGGLQTLKCREQLSWTFDMVRAVSALCSLWT